MCDRVKPAAQFEAGTQDDPEEQAFAAK